MFYNTSIQITSIALTFVLLIDCCLSLDKHYYRIFHTLDIEHKKVTFLDTSFFTKLSNWTEKNKVECNDDLKRFTKKIDIFNMRCVLIPANIGGGHWVLYVLMNPCSMLKAIDIHNGQFDEKDKKDNAPFLLYFDSLRRIRPPYVQKIYNWFFGLCNNDPKFNDHQTDLEDTMKHKRLLPVINVNGAVQNNGNDCGLFVCRNAYNSLISCLNDCNVSFQGMEDTKDASNSILENFGEQWKYDQCDIETFRIELRTLYANMSVLAINQESLKETTGDMALSGEKDGNPIPIGDSESITTTARVEGKLDQDVFINDKKSETSAVPVSATVKKDTVIKTHMKVGKMNEKEKDEKKEQASRTGESYIMSKPSSKEKVNYCIPQLSVEIMKKILPPSVEESVIKDLLQKSNADLDLAVLSYFDTVDNKDKDKEETELETKAKGELKLKSNEAAINKEKMASGQREVAGQDEGPDMKDNVKTPFEKKEKIGLDDIVKVKGKPTSNPIEKNKDTAGSKSGQNKKEATTAAMKNALSCLKPGDKKASLNPIADSKHVAVKVGTETKGKVDADSKAKAKAKAEGVSKAKQVAQAHAQTEEMEVVSKIGKKVDTELKPKVICVVKTKHQPQGDAKTKKIEVLRKRVMKAVTEVESEAQRGSMMKTKGENDVKATSTPIKINKGTAGPDSGQRQKEIKTEGSKDEVSTLLSGKKKASVNSIHDPKDADKEKGTLKEGEGAGGAILSNKAVTELEPKGKGVVKAKQLAQGDAQTKKIEVLEKTGKKVVKEVEPKAKRESMMKTNLKNDVKATSNTMKINKGTAGPDSGQSKKGTITEGSKDEVSTLLLGKKKASVNSIDDPKDVDKEKGTLTEGEGAAGVILSNDSESLKNLNTGFPRGNDNA